MANSNSSGSARSAAIAAVTSYAPSGPPMNFIDTPTQELFKANIFGKAAMKERLPKPIYKKLVKTIETGETRISILVWRHRTKVGKTRFLNCDRLAGLAFDAASSR